MSSNSKIEWCDRTWNPILGCDKVSPGCDSCYAITQARIRAGNPNPKIAEAFAGLTERTPAGLDWTGKVNLLPERLTQPLSWRKPSRVFVNSLADLFHQDVPEGFIARVFAVMASSPAHTFQVLTKRHARMRSLLSREDFWLDVFMIAESEFGGSDREWPLPNVWLGVSAEDQHWAEIRVHALLATPAEVRWVSAEPLLGPIDLRNLKMGNGALIDALCGDVKTSKGEIYAACPGSVSWIVCGGESGPAARPMLPDWARSLRDQCQSARVPYLFKQWGEWGPTGYVGAGGHDPREIFVRDSTVTCHEFEGAQLRKAGKKATGRELDGRTWDEYPREAAAVLA